MLIAPHASRKPIMAWLFLLAAIALIACPPASAQTGIPRFRIDGWARDLSSDNVRKRFFAANKLISLKDPAALDALRKAMEADQPEAIRLNVIETFKLEKVNDKAITDLITCLGDKSEKIRIAAADAVRAIQTPGAVTALRKTAKDTEAALHVRTQTIDILGEQRDLNAVPTLIALLSDPEKAIREASGEALGKITLRRFDTTHEWLEWWEKVRGDKRVKILEEMVKLQVAQIERMEQIIDRLYLKLLKDRKNQDDPTMLIEALKEGSVKVKLYAIGEIMRIKPADEADVKVIVEALVNTLSDAKAGVRAAAADALSKRHHPITTAGLIRALSDSIPIVRQSAAKALGTLKDTLAVASLAGALKDKNDDVVSAAAIALGEIGDREAVEPLIAILKERPKDSKVYASVAQALSGIKDPVVLPILIAPLLTSKHESIRWHAVKGLGLHEPKKVIPHLTKVALDDPKAKVRRAALDTLAKTDSMEALPPIVRGLSDKGKDVSRQALNGLRVLANRRSEFFEKAMLILIKGGEFVIADKVLETALDEFGALPNHAKTKAHLRYQLATGLIQAKAWKSAEPHLEKLYGTDQRNVAYVRDLIACRKALKDHEGVLEILKQARAILPNEKVEWWKETLAQTNQLFEARKYKQVVELVEALKKEDETLGGQVTVFAFEELRKKAEANLPANGDAPPDIPVPPVN
jgi:HEAT repeat protein